MIRHVAIFNWTEDATTEQIAAFAAGLSAMPAKVDVIRSYQHGDDLELGAGTADYVLVADFDTVEAYGEYAVHPDHLEFVTEFVRPIVASVHRVQCHIPA